MINNELLCNQNVLIYICYECQPETRWWVFKPKPVDNTNPNVNIFQTIRGLFHSFLHFSLFMCTFYNVFMYTECYYKTIPSLNYTWIMFMFFYYTGCPRCIGRTRYGFNTNSSSRPETPCMFSKCFRRYIGQLFSRIA